MTRDEHNFLRGLNEAPKDFKAWRNTSSYQSFARIVASSTRDFTQNCNFVEHTFDASAFERRLAIFEEEPRDLNDELILEICESCNLKLVTHDGDFGHSNVEILTANSRYLR